MYKEYDYWSSYSFFNTRIMYTMLCTQYLYSVYTIYLLQYYVYNIYIVCIQYVVYCNMYTVYLYVICPALAVSSVTPLYTQNTPSQPTRHAHAYSLIVYTCNSLQTFIFVLIVYTKLFQVQFACIQYSFIKISRVALKK